MIETYFGSQLKHRFGCFMIQFSLEISFQQHLKLTTQITQWTSQELGHEALYQGATRSLAIPTHSFRFNAAPYSATQPFITYLSHAPQFEPPTYSGDMNEAVRPPIGSYKCNKQQFWLKNCVSHITFQEHDKLSEYGPARTYSIP